MFIAAFYIAADDYHKNFASAGIQGMPWSSKSAIGSPRGVGAPWLKFFA
jgi:hypothetical protein